MMGVGFSSLGGRSSTAWWDAWPQSTSGSEQQRARRPDEFEGVELEQEEPVPPVTVAEVRAFEAQQAARWRAPDPAALPARWPATALQLWANLTQTVEQVRQASMPTRQIRSVPDGSSVEPAQRAAQGENQSGPASSADSAGDQYLASWLDKLEDALLGGPVFHFSENIAQTAQTDQQARAPNRHIRNAASGTGADEESEPAQPADPSLNRSASASAADNAGGRYLASELDKLMPWLLSDYLIAQGYAEVGEQPGCGQNSTVLTAMHQHLAPARDFVGDPAALDRLNPDARAKLMRHVARERGFYGARDGEQSAPEFQRQLLIRLISLWATGCAPASGTHIIAPGLPAVKTHESIAWIRVRELSRLQASGLTADASEWVAGMLWADVEPTVVRTDTPGDLRYGSLEWADLQTGIDTASALGLDHWKMSRTELAALAQAVDMTVRLQPEAAAGLLALQVRAALVFAGMSLEPEDPDARENVEHALTSLNERRTARWEMLQQRQHTLEALHAPIPTRSQLAEQILSDHGIHPAQTFRTLPLLGVPPVGGHVESVTDTALNLYLDGRRSLNGARLPDVDEQFNQAFTQHKDKVQQAIALLFGETIPDLAEEDRIFWRSGDAQILLPQVQDRRSLEQGSLATRPVLANSLAQAKPLTALVAITHGGQTRHYLATAASAEGRLIRFLARDLPRDGGASPDNAKILDDTLLPYIDDLFTHVAVVKAAEQRRWKLVPGAASGHAVPIQVLAQYFTEPIENLREQAYQPTANQQALQRIRNGMLSLIPLYNCVTEAQAGNTGNAVLSCTLDVVSLIPVAGTALKVGVGAAKLTVQVSTSVLRQLAQTSAKALLSQQALRPAVAEIARTVPLATSFARSSGRALAWDAANLLDPGFQLVGSVGKGVLRGGRALLNSLRQLPGLETLADRISTSLKRNPFHFVARAGIWQVHTDAVARRDGRQFVQIGEREVEVMDLGDVPRVPVVRVADHADARFILVEPLQGRPYGPEWVPTAEGFAALGDYRVRLEGPVPDPDAGGIIHLGQRDYIQVDAEYYPVRHDADRQSWRIQRENEDAPIPVRYDAGRGQWEIHGDDGASGAVAARRPSLDDLPAEMQSGIASQLADADTGRMSQVSHHWDAVLEQERRAGQLAEEARSVGRLAQIRALLGGASTEGIEGLRMSLRDRPLVALTERIGELPELERLAAFQCLFDAIGALPASERGMPLAALARRLGDLTGVSRQTEYQRIFDATLRLGRHRRAGPLAALADGLGQLADDHPVRRNAFGEIIRETLLLDARHRALPLAALAAAIPHLPASVRGNRFDLVFAEVGTLPMGQRAGPLALLSEQIGVLHRDDRQSAFDRMLEPIEVLRAPHRAELLTSLSGQIESLNEIDRQPSFNRLLEQIDALPAQQRAVPLDALTNQVPTLPEDGWLQPFNSAIRAAVWLDAGGHGEQLTRVVEHIVRLPTERRLVAVRSLLRAVETLDPERRAGQYTQLARRIFQLPEPQRLEGFDAVFGATLRLPAERRAVPLVELADNFLWMPDQRQPDEFKRILGQIDEVPAEHRDLLLDALTKQVRRLPPELRPDAFEDLVIAATAPDAGVQGEPLLRLARIVGQLPEERQTAAFDRLARATAPLDAGVRGEQLMRLARLGERLPADRLAAFRSLLRAVETLDVARRGEQYVEFARLIHQLPYHQRLDLFNAVFTATLALPAQYRVLPLQALTARIRLLPETWRLDAIRRVGHEMNKLSPQTWNAALTALVEQFGSQPERRWGMFATLTHASALATPDKRAALLRTLTNRIRLVEPPTDRGRAWRSVLLETEKLATHPRAMAHVALADQLGSIIQSDDDRLDAFNSLLAAIRQLPPQHRGAPLMAAEDNIHLLPEAARPAASNGILDSRAGDPAG